MKFNSEQEAVNKGMVRITDWLINSDESCQCLEKFHEGVMRNPKRSTMYVRRMNEITLFADNAKSATPKKVPNLSKKVSVGYMKSESHKFKNIRHVLEVAFHKNPKLSFDEFKKVVLKEFPWSAAAGKNCYRHYLVYRSEIAIRKEFRYINAT